LPGGSLLVLLDDITSVLDDVALLTKLASQKTAGVLGDDLALNAQQIAGVNADRELPVVWAVAKGSLVNKAILVPSALAFSACAPWGIAPLLICGGTYLCFEGFEKVLHTLLHHSKNAPQQPLVPGSVASQIDSDATLQSNQSAQSSLEAERIRGAIRTDFVLSAEIVTIALGSVAHAAFLTQVLALITIGVVMTVGVYGFVAAIVKLDDLGLYLCTLGNRRGFGIQTIGRGILVTAPWLMRALTIVGTLAMFVVGGGIIAHGLQPIHHLHEALNSALLHYGSITTAAAQSAFAGLIGVFAGWLTWVAVASVNKVRIRFTR